MSNTTKNYHDNGGDTFIVGGDIEVKSGGEIDIESGGALKIAGTAVTASAAEINQLDGLAVGTGAATLVTAASTNVAAADNGKVLIATKADGASTFVLPAPAAGLAGVAVTILQSVDQNLVIDGTADKMIVFGGNGTSKTATWSTGGEKRGAGAYCVCTGTMWLVVGLGKGTITVA